MNPFLVLGLPEHCTDDDVRQAYQALLRLHPPEKDPYAVKLINNAYNAVNTPLKRATYVAAELHSAATAGEFFPAPAAAGAAAGRRGTGIAAWLRDIRKLNLETLE